MRRASILTTAIRSGTLFAIGCFGLYHEITGTQDRPWILGASLMMVGLSSGDFADMIKAWMRQRGGG